MIIEKINFKIKKKKYEYSLGEELEGHKIERIELIRKSKGNYKEFNIYVLNKNHQYILYRTLYVPTRYFIKITYVLAHDIGGRPEWRKTK